jgi:O-acetyl-ADP-ribose deacetylase (regulator of RNase III)
VAFPAISTGIFGYPADLAARVAVREIAAWLDANALPGQVLLCMFGDESAATMAAALTDLGRPDLTARTQSLGA